MQSYVHHAAPGRAGGPLLVLAHGTGGDENQFTEVGRELVPDAFIVAPRGDVSENGARRFFRRSAEGVYDMADLARAAAKMAAFVRAHAESVSASRTLGLGYSNGANILAAALFGDPGLFDEVVLMHPLIPFQPQVDGDLAGTRILITAGRHDPICPPALTSRLEAYLRAAGSDVTVVWHQGGHEIRPSEIDAAGRFFAETGSGAMADVGMPIEVEETGSKGRYVLRSPAGDLAELTFTRVGEHRIILDHTEVPDAFRGQGAGLRLVSRAVDDARAAGKKIIPLCPFARAQFRRHDEWADVLEK